MSDVELELYYSYIQLVRAKYARERKKIHHQQPLQAHGILFPGIFFKSRDIFRESRDIFRESRDTTRH